MHPIFTYLTSVQEIHNSGAAVKETSYYPALSALFNAIGKSLKPPVYCVSILTNVGAGFPDGGFFTKSQNQALEKEDDASKKKEMLRGTKPERGVLEVKGAAQNLDALIASNQVKKYAEEYGLVLVCNLRKFALVDWNGGKARKIEEFSLCDEADKFWSLSPQKISESLGEECEEFLKRCLLTGAPLQSPQDVATFLASYARQARIRLASVELEVLDPLKEALESALGVKFEAVDKPGKKLTEIQKREQGERFFRATLVQTLFYGLFSAWLSHVKEKPGKEFRWTEAQYSLHVPMVSTLFEELIKSSNMRSLGLQELIELSAEMLNRVDSTAFLEKWNGSDAIQYFYEPFLERFDPTLRKELGVYYTPREIVQYMTARVHRVLQDELGIEGGLANEDVMILDPCCGTGAFVLETLRVIGKELEKGPKNRVADKLKQAALNRVFGFEILPAPFVVAHHGVIDLLKGYGATFKGEDRAPIYLTNALTGWASEPDIPMPFPGFVEERKLAQKVKQEDKILVIIGNPPYDAFAKIEEDDDLIAPYKKGLFRDWGISRNSLGDLYVRFFRIAERKLSNGGQGVLCFVSNHSWTTEDSFVVMRKHMLDSFDSIWVENMHGNRKISERSPDGKTSETIFAIPGFSVGIQQGITISTLVKRKEKETDKRVLYNNNLAAARASQRRKDLLESLNAPHFDGQYETVQPHKENKFRLRPHNVTVDYAAWPRVIDLSQEFHGGPLERRGNTLIVHQSEVSRLYHLKKYLDEKVPNDEISALVPRWMISAGEFVADVTRKNLKGKVKWSDSAVVPYPFKPFDLRTAYLDSEIAPLFSRPAPELLKHAKIPGNAFFITRDGSAKQIEGAPMLFSSVVCDYDSLSGHARHFPIFVKEKLEKKRNKANLVLDLEDERVVANLSVEARAYLSDLGFEAPDTDAESAALLWHHALAIGYSDAYLAEHTGGLASDWPRVPLPLDAATLVASARLGAQVAEMLDMARPAQGIDNGFRKELEPFGMLCGLAGTPEDGDQTLGLNENWGFFGPRGIVQPGTPRLISRDPNVEEIQSLKELGLPLDTPMLDLPLCRDKENKIVLSWWSGVPQPVWDYVIGGYPVLKKWLSYRDERVLDRALHLSEAQEVENIVRRLVVLWSLSEKLNENYTECAANCRALVVREESPKLELD